MKELIEWLIKIEGTASELYGRAARAFGNDPGLSELLAKLASDERLHYEAMEKALGLSRSLDLPVVITLEADAQKEIEDSLKECSEKMGSGLASKNDIMDFIVCSEFSEWNDVFLYVVNTLKRVDPANFKPAAINCQKHKRHIERYFETRPGLSSHHEKIKKLTRVWEEKILVVDDDEIVFDAVKSVLSAEGRIDGAVNGKEALDMLLKEYYAVIISDMDMPVMDGIRFFEQAREMFPGIGKRFIFFSGGIDHDRSSYIRSNNLRFLAKPFTIRQIKSFVAEMLS